MSYLFIKAFHLAAVMTFVGGLLALSISSRMSNLSAIRIVLRWDRRVTLPALALVWITGLTIASQGQWFGANWLTPKLVLVAVLSALHGVLAGALRRVEQDAEAVLPGPLQRSGMMVIAGVGAIAMLAVLKPS